MDSLRSPNQPKKHSADFQPKSHPPTNNRWG